ncbi:regulatory protein, luxR family [Microbulbifer donghaiensis]|uniref:Regulatory protein, luxR family n=1 Tax=Microbulbifer donghaiensis TaxID=494016 RepID=A0A1M4Z1Z0_9GAMM|nr:LuxR C-terminal-related transcriptional regulator [Microbulbifer donghaiensis]SHF12010.1 regulatory protein, luxR family [Microbulbifer donghaiensis]
MPVLFVSNSGLHGELLFTLISESLPFSWERAELGRQRHCLQQYQAIVIDCWQTGLNSDSTQLSNQLKALEHPKILLINFPAELSNLTTEKLKQKRIQLLCDTTATQETLIKRLGNAIRGPETESSLHNPNSFLLTKREQEILTQLTSGQPNSAIASKLHLSEHTVKNHMYNIFRKIGVKNRLQASNWAKMHLQAERI